MKPLLCFTLSLAFALASSTALHAAPHDWDGSSPYEWDQSSNWSPPASAVGPGALDDATFPAGLPATKAVLLLNNLSRSINSLTFDMAGTDFLIGGQGGFGAATPQLNVGTRIRQNSGRKVVINPDVICGTPFTLDGTGGGDVDFTGSFLGSPDLIVNGPGSHRFRIGASTTGLNLNSIDLNGGTLEIVMSNTVNVVGNVVIDTGTTLRLCQPSFSSATFNAPQVIVGGTLFGNTTVNATVTVSGGAVISAGCSPGTLTIGGNLTLSPTSVLDFELDTPGVVGGGVNDLIVVNGNLSLAGILNVTPFSGFGAGTYRLFDYTGALSGPGLTLGSRPSGYTYAVSTATAGQVNLIVTPAAASPVSLVSTGSVWTYLDDGSDQGTVWSSPAFDDSGWATGVALFGVDPSFTYPWPFRTPLPVGGGRITYYFRTHFNWSGSTAGVVLEGTGYFDDGAVFYLNGVEAGRLRITASPVLFDSLAAASTEGPLETLTLSSASLVPGDNVLAVEVHQTSPGSSDVTMGLTLTGRSPSADTNPPVLVSASIDCLDNKVTLTFSEPLSPATAQNAANYSISGGATIFGATLSVDGLTVCLSASPLVGGASYTVTISGV